MENFLAPLCGDAEGSTMGRRPHWKEPTPVLQNGIPNSGHDVMHMCLWQLLQYLNIVINIKENPNK